MASWWIAEPDGRVLGPVSLEAVQQLWSSRTLSREARLSTDGKSWMPIEAVPQVVEASHRETPAARAEREKREAAALLRKLQELRARPPHEVFGVPVGASLETFREAFFRISKPYHPDRLPGGTEKALADAHALAFRFFGSLMTRVENGLHRAPGATPANGHAAVAAAPPRIAPGSGALAGNVRTPALAPEAAPPRLAAAPPNGSPRSVPPPVRQVIPVARSITPPRIPAVAHVTAPAPRAVTPPPALAVAPTPAVAVAPPSSPPRSATPPPSLAVAPPASAAAAPSNGTAAAAAESNRYAAESFVGIKQLPWGNYETSIRVTKENVGMFLDHPMMNLKMNGFFLACDQRLPMGSYLDLRFDFGEVTIETRGKVAMESAGGRYARGLGISLFNLDASLRTRLQELVSSLSRSRSA